MKRGRFAIFIIAYLVILIISGCGNNRVPDTSPTPLPIGDATTPSTRPTGQITPTDIPLETLVPTPVERTLYNILKNMLLTGDCSEFDVSDLKVTYTDVSNTFNDLINGECLVAYASYDGIQYTVSSKGDDGYLTSTRLALIDAGFSLRFEAVQLAVNEALGQIETWMSDFEKALVLHDYIVDKASYTYGSDGQYYAWGILAIGKGVCKAYAEAYSLLLNLVGIENYGVVSNEMNHMWNIVNIDGEWYHVDCTWDDTRSPQKGEISRYYFMRNDDEFQNKLSSLHYSYAVQDKGINILSTSNRFTNCEIHDITGKLNWKESDKYSWK